MKKRWCSMILLCFWIGVGFRSMAQGTSPADRGFVYTDGHQFMLNGKPYYFTGTNWYDLFTYGGTSGNPETDIDKRRIDRAMETMYNSGVRVLRTWGFSHEDWHGFEPSKGVYSERQFMLFDYIVKSAKEHGIKLVVTLENYWNDYGGLKARMAWEGVSVTGTHGQGVFFTHPAAIQGYKNYVKYFITRVNHYSGVAYKDDPTIFAWELMNEPRYQGFGDDVTSNVLRAWIDNVGAFIKSIDSNHLLGTGAEGQSATKYGFGGDTGTDFVKVHQSPYIDFCSAHPYYTATWAHLTMEQSRELTLKWIRDAHEVVKKPFYIGEFQTEHPSERVAWWTMLFNLYEQNNVGGDGFWLFRETVQNTGFDVAANSPEIAVLKQHCVRQESKSSGEVASLTLLSPRGGAKYLPGSLVVLKANLINLSGTVRQVEFFRNGVSMGKDTTAPYELQWPNAPAGDYVLTAVAKDASGRSQASEAVPITVGTGALFAEYRNGATALSTNVIQPQFNLVNQTEQDILYKDLKIRYWYTLEDSARQLFFCDFAKIGSSNVSGSFVRLREREYYLEISFAEGAGTLAAQGGISDVINTRFFKDGYTHFNQADDYSYTAFTTYTPWNRVGLYYKGQLVWGLEPAQATQVPTASFTATPTSGTLPLSVRFDASASSDPTSEPLTYTWNFGDGSIGTGKLVTHIYTAIGNFTAKLTVTDPDGFSAQQQKSITVFDSNVAPVASFTATPLAGIAPVLVQLDASASSDVNGDVLTYSWNFGDTTTGTGKQTSHTYTAPGVYTITLVVSDGRKQNTTTRTITVTDGTPVASFVASPTQGVPPLLVLFDASASVDPAGDVLTYSWNFGDGTVGTGRTVQHVFTLPRSYTVVLTVKNSANKTAVASKTISLQDGTNNCTFGTPRVTPLPTISHSQYTKLYVLGTGGPNLSNVTNLTINWDLANNGLWQFSMQTSNGVPGWYNDLRLKAVTRFNQPQPEVTFTNSGFSGLDGSYYVTVEAGNFVLVSKDRPFTLYCSNSPTSPICNLVPARRDVQPAALQASLWPNPSSGEVHLLLSDYTAVQEIRLTTLQGKTLLTLSGTSLKKEAIVLGKSLPAGMYLVIIQNRSGSQTLRWIKN